MKRLTTKDFIKKAKAVHGDKYDYSKTVYVNQKTDVIITCPLHGDFKQRPNNHYMGAGCPVCSGNKKSDTDNFIEKAKAVHGNKYSYSRVLYTNNKTPVEIICPIHGVFKQTPDKHLSGQGCPMCAGEKLENTNIKKYGVKRPLQNKSVYDKMVQTNIDKYSTVNVGLVPEFCEKRRETFEERYGVDNVNVVPGVKEKIQDTNMKRYGGISPFSSADVRAKAKETVMRNYGVDNVSRSPAIMAKQRQSMKKKYGVEYPLQSDIIYNKVRQTCMNRYDSVSPLSSSIVREKIKRTVYDKYGVSNVAQSLDVQNKIQTTKRQNGTFNTSNSEDNLYNILCEVFGKDDVMRQYSSDLYPFSCDFYIKSRDMYIELNAHWSHGGHWYNAKNDNAVLCEWIDKHTEYYDNAVSVWSQKDVLKRQTAMKNKLNYIVFWDYKLRDASVWRAFGCSDGRDYDKLYSWLPDRKLDGDYVLNNLYGMQAFSALAKCCQFKEFYHREIAMWNENKVYHGVPLQIFIYHNRLIYGRKDIRDLSDLDIARAFGISGILRSYSVFDASLMNIVINKYHIKSVYDPCAGWGERMLCCNDLGVSYTGVDINISLADGYDRMISDFAINNSKIIFADSAVLDINNHYDAVITCPPYGDTEIYSSDGAENLSSDEFLKWWGTVVEKCRNIKYFCFQINNKWKSKMFEIVCNQGFKLIEELHFNSVRSSHFTRRNGVNTKREFETMLVFKRS